MKFSNEHKKIELIHRSDFVEWVLKPSADSDNYWAAYLDEYPSQKQELEHARFLIKGISHEQKTLSDDDTSFLWNKIRTTNNSKKKSSHLKRWSVAAGILLVLGFSGWWFSTTIYSKSGSINYQSIAVAVPPGNEIRLILSDNTQKTFTAKDVELKYNQQGRLETKIGIQVQSEELSKNAEVKQMNQIVVPRGKRSTIVLADGTKLWLNSGSRAIYPVVFNGKTREIYIEGEGYLEVMPDATKPFYVVTDQIKVKVLGTKFNISAYKEDDHVSVVLVEGSVQACINVETILMKPNQLLNYGKITQRSSLERTNVLEYVSWKDGWMLCNQEPIESITKKLERYYDVKISFNNMRLNMLTITGKLDLKNNCEDVLKVICATAPLDYQITDNSIFLTIKE